MHPTSLITHHHPINLPELCPNVRPRHPLRPGARMPSLAWDIETRGLPVRHPLPSPRAYCTPQLAAPAASCSFGGGGRDGPEWQMPRGHCSLRTPGASSQPDCLLNSLDCCWQSAATCNAMAINQHPTPMVWPRSLAPANPSPLAIQGRKRVWQRPYLEAASHSAVKAQPKRSQKVNKGMKQLACCWHRPGGGSRHSTVAASGEACRNRPKPQACTPPARTTRRSAACGRAQGMWDRAGGKHTAWAGRHGTGRPPCICTSTRPPPCALPGAHGGKTAGKGVRVLEVCAVQKVLPSHPTGPDTTRCVLGGGVATLLQPARWECGPPGSHNLPAHDAPEDEEPSPRPKRKVLEQTAAAKDGTAIGGRALGAVDATMLMHHGPRAVPAALLRAATYNRSPAAAATAAAALQSPAT